MSKVKMVKSVEEYNAAIAGSGLGMSLRARIHGPVKFEKSTTSLDYYLVRFRKPSGLWILKWENRISKYFRVAMKVF